MFTSKPSRPLRIAAMGDLHCTPSSLGKFREIFAAASEEADVIALCGDLTDYGTTIEAKILADEIQFGAHVPVTAVLGNHDAESEQEAELCQILRNVGVVMLEGGPMQFHDVDFIGTKGFGGGFLENMLAPWGERTTKRFVQEAVDEAMKLEMALGRSRAAQCVVLLHYAPIRQTLEGEAAEILPFLGATRLEDPLNRYPVSVVFHGHAHFGSCEGTTRNGVPVYNVAMPLLRRRFPDRPPFRVVELPPSPASVN